MHRAAAFAGAIEHWLTHRDEREPLNLAALYDYLVAEHSYPGSLRSLQRYFKAHYPQPPIRARRRVETPPGAQAQADWGDFPPEARAAIFDYIERFYNPKRRHSTLGGLSPVEYEERAKQA